MRSGRRAAGFTLIELLMVIVIVAILVALGMPSMRDLIASTKVKTATSDVFASLIFARSEAIKRNSAIEIAPIDTTNWNAGWRVRPAGTTTNLTVQDALTGDVAIGGPNANIRYRGDGRLTDASGAPLNASFTFIATAFSHIQMRCIKIDPSGRPSVRTDTDRVTANGCN
jgi:type IV fimbrial biogenesis protein FimT